MKFYKCEGKKKMVSLENVISISITENSGRSQVRWGIAIRYANDAYEYISYISEAEANKIFNEMLKILEKPLDNPQ